MSQREDKNGETGKDTSQKSLLLSLWKKVAGGKGDKKRSDAQDAAGQNVPVPEAQPAPEEIPTQPEELPFEKQPAPDYLMEYYILFCQNQGKVEEKDTVEDFCSGDRPDMPLLGQIFTQIEARATAVMKEYHKQARVAMMKAEQRLKERKRELEGKPEKPQAQEEPAAPTPPLNGQVLVFCAPDWSAAWGIALPALGEGEPVTWETVVISLDEKKVSFGIDQGAVEHLATPEGALTLQKLAACEPPTRGEDGKIIEHFPRTVGTPQIVENAQGIVDFNNLDWLTHIDQGTVICEVVQPTQGQPGTNIQGNPMRPYNGKKAVLPKGDNVVPNEDGSALVSKIDGQISFRDGKFHVNNVIVIQGDVDLSTGSIDVQGDVVIHGNVRAGFTVTASGNVTIGGLVEGSQITAGGSVVVNRGMNGNVTGKITAGKDVICKYMENATVSAMGEVRMDSIVNCDISARGKIIVKTGRGVIIGGTVRGMGGIDAKTIGNFAGRLTTLVIGPTPLFVQEKGRIEEELERLEKEIQDKKGTGQAALLQIKLKPLKKVLEELELQETAASQKQVVAGTLYPAAQVTIGGVVKNITESYSPCRIYLDAKEGIIKIIGV